MTKPCRSLSSNNVFHSSSGITAPVGLPGEQTYSSCVRAQVASSICDQSAAKLRAGSLLAKAVCAPASSAAPS